MKLTFLIPRVERLGADGRFETLVHGSALSRLRPTVVLLDRELCAFSLFPTAALPRGRRAQAARLHARLASPYVVGGSALVRTGQDYGVWWWDLARVQTALVERFGRSAVAVRPETLAQPTGQGWRQVKLRHGYEAQFWSADGLVASAWRAARFDPQAWSMFARLQRTAEATETPPVPQTLPLSLSGEAFRITASEISREQAIGAAAAGAAVVACSTALFLTGQGLALSREADGRLAEAAAIRERTPSSAGTAGVVSDRQRLQAFRAIEEQTSPVSAAGAAIGIATLYELEPRSLDVDGELLTLTLPYAALEESEALIREFEQSGYFYEVQPRTDAARQALVMEMKIRGAAPPPAAPG